MELTVFDFEQMAKVGEVMREAALKIEAITGKLPDLRLHDTPPTKQLVDYDDDAVAIMSMAAYEFNVTLDDLKSKSRRHPLPDARGVAMIAINKHTRLALKTIGLHFGGRDHSTVHTRIADTWDLAETEPQLMATINKVLDQAHKLTMYVKPERDRGAA